MATDEAYLRTCRALNWRNAQLRAHGIEPLKLTDEHGHEPPLGFDFGVPEKRTFAPPEEAAAEQYDPAFVEAWIAMEEAGYLYSESNIAKVYMGWQMARAAEKPNG